MKYPREYECFSAGCSRLKVPGGWIYSEFYNEEGQIACCACFIPDPKHLWVLEDE